jgi:hypothetical protein
MAILFCLKLHRSEIFVAADKIRRKNDKVCAFLECVFGSKTMTKILLQQMVLKSVFSDHSMKY